MPTPTKYDPALAYDLYIVQKLSWADTSRICWPGVNPNNTAGARSKLRRTADVGRSPGGMKSAPAASTDSLKPVETDSTEYCGDKLVRAFVARERIRTVEQLIAAAEVDTDVWEVERFVCNAWEVGAKTADELTALPLFQVKAWFRRNRLKEAVAASVEYIVARMDAHSPTYLPVRRRIEPSGLLWEVSPCDTHLGKFAWGRETGWANYDLDIATSLFRQAMGTLIARAAHWQFERIAFVVGHDFFNADNKQGTTTRGTPQNMDGRHPKIFERGYDLCVETIDQMRLRAPVEIIVVPGNHDELSAWHLGATLAAHYRRDGDVQVDNRPLPRKYLRHGRNLIGLSHGDRIKPDYGAVMAREVPRDFAETCWQEWHCGHLHKAMKKLTMVDDARGVVERILPSLCAPDDWHSQEAYIAAVRTALSFVWDADGGLIDQPQYNVTPEHQALAEAA